MTEPPSSLRRWARVAFGTFGAGFLLVALVRQWDQVRNTLEVSVPRLGVGLLLTVLSTMALAQAWATLLPSASDRWGMRRIFYIAQPVKYIPGGFAQPIGQVALTAAEGVSVGLSVTAFVVHAIAGVVAGAGLGAAVALISEVPTWLRLVALGGFLAPLMLWRPVLLRAVRVVSRLTRRDLSEDLIPKQRVIRVAFGWALVGVLGSAVAFATIGGTSIAAPGWEMVAAFSFAFTVGYLAIPFPSGIGVREGVLALVLPATGLAAIVAISAIHRVVAMTGELLLLSTTRSKRTHFRKPSKQTID